MKKLFKINEQDNVYIVKVPLTKGELLEIEGQQIVVPYDLGRGHKLAACDIPKGDQVFKFGLPIGSATIAIQIGEHVHLHNLKSNYLPTYSKDDRFNQ